MFFYILGGLIALAIVGKTATFIHRRRQRKAKARVFKRELAQLVSRRRRSDRTVDPLIMDNAWNVAGRAERFEYAPDLWYWVVELRRQIQFERSVQQACEQLKELSRQWENAESFESRVAVALEAKGVYKRLKRSFWSHPEAALPKDMTQILCVGSLRDQLNAELRARYDGLLAEAASNRDSFVELHELIGKTRKKTPQWSQSTLVRLGLDKLPYPRHWNEWVAKYHDNPPLAFFVYGSLEPGDARLRAVKAVKSQDPVEIKLLLAYANAWPRIHAEIGEGLLTELARLVAFSRTNQRSKT